MTKRKPKQPVRLFRLYAWHPDRKASKTCLRYFIARAMKDKLWALQKATPEWRAVACTVSNQWADECLTLTVRQLARQALEYQRMRAFMGGAYGGDRTGDRPAAALWDRLNA